MNTRLFKCTGMLGVASICLLIGLAGRAEALPLVDQGDTTLDPNSGLEWLDVSLTTNRSFADISLEFGPGGDFEGFRHATTQELVEFFTNAGIPEVNGGFAVPNAPFVAALLLLVGSTDQGTKPDQAAIPGNTDFTLTQGNTDDMLSGVLEHRFNRTNEFPDVGWASTGESLGAGMAPLSGHWLVRAVPLPPPGPLSIDTGLFTQNRVRQCSSDMLCIGGDPTIEVQSDFDLSTTGSVSTHVSVESLGAQGATSAGYNGDALTPALSAYAYTSGPQRYTLGSFGFQKYEFNSTAELTITGTLTFSQTGQTFPQSENQKGRVRGGLVVFQMQDDVFDPERCNIFGGFGASNISGTLFSCVTRNGQSGIVFQGLENVQIATFDNPSGPVSNGSSFVELTVMGDAGDIFFLAADISVQAHLSGFGDARNTLLVEIDQPAAVNPSFSDETYTPAPASTVAIDVKPGSDPNCFNVNGHGVIPVAILGSEVFDVLNIEQSSLTFGGLTVAMPGKRGPMCHAEYSNGDEYLDLTCQFESDVENWSPDSSEQASIEGELIDGRPISGTDSICVVPLLR